MSPRVRRAFLFALIALLVCAVPALTLADDSATITGNGVNLRSGPGTAYASLAKLYAGDAISVTGTRGNWYAVTHNGTAGYVYRTYVKLAASAISATGTTLKVGTKGSAVKELQRNLITLGYLANGADGIFGSKTKAAVLQYQKRNALATDGIAGSKTVSAIQREVGCINTVMNTAKKYLGLAYLYGGTSPDTGFDCSGLTQYAFAEAGITIPRVSYEQAASGISVPNKQLRVGDLVAFNSPVSHVGIYIGNGKFIHSPKTGDVVKITSVSAMKLTAIRRFTGVLAS